MEIQDTDKLRRAKIRIEEVKGFYVHLMVYLMVNAFIILYFYLNRSDPEEGIWHLNSLFTAIFWGIGLAFHAAKTFGLNPFLGKSWEDRMIKKFMEEDRKQAKKYKN